MKEPRGAKTSRVLNALLAGRVLTPFDANNIGRTSDGTRIIRTIRTMYPVKKQRVPGELYCKYWIDKEYLAELKKIGKQISDGTFFDNLLAAH